MQTVAVDLLDLVHGRGQSLCFALHVDIKQSGHKNIIIFAKTCEWAKAPRV